MTAPQSVGVVIGQNLRRLRVDSGLTQHEAARLLHRFGLPWSRSKIAALEAGERPSVAFADVLMLAMAFNASLAELFDGDGDVQMAGHIVLPRRVVRELLLGLHVRQRPDDQHPRARREALLHLERTLAAFTDTSHAGATEADQALATRLQVPLRTVTDIALQLWDRTLTDERDARVAALGPMDPGERQAHRGHLTRELSEHIETQLNPRKETT